MSRKTQRNGRGLLLGMNVDDDGVVGNDVALEEELAAILSGVSAGAPKTAKKGVSKVAIDDNLLKLDLDDEDVGDLDENDPDLLAELNDMLSFDEPEAEKIQAQLASPKKSSEQVKTLENLKNLYKIAIMDSQSCNDTSKSRRYERSLKSIDELLAKALKGETVNEADFPPAVYVKSKVVVSEVKPAELPKNQLPSPPKRIPPEKSEEKMVMSSQVQANIQPKNNVLESLIQRQLEYKSAAFNAKTKDIELAKGLMTVVKQFDQVIQEVKNGVAFDLEDLPPPPSQFSLSDLNMEEEIPVPLQKPEITKSLEDELNVRREFYKVSMEKAKVENNPSKMRRLMRVIQQYDEAIMSYKKKTLYPYEELPPPPGKSPLSKAGGSIPLSTPQLKAETNKSSPQTSVNKTVHYLLQKQAEFKAAALKAKNDGDLPLAKELLRQSKGFDQMIQASESGFPIDLSKIPSLPTENDFNFELVNVDLCEIPDDMKTEDKQTLFRKLQISLLEQIKTCKTYQQNVMKAGDVIGAKRFETLANSCEKDLNGLKCLIQSNADIPKFHYEFKILTVMKSNPDLGENELAVEVIKGVDLAVPQGFTAEQLDTYIILELPFPNDNFQTYTTETIRHTNNPVYNSTTKFEINPKSRVFHRIVKSKQLKADIYYRKGFLQKDKVLGTCNIKLEKLENNCVIHELFDIQENRKIIGGKLEVRLRLRNAITGAQSENVKEKWLVIDEFNKNSEKAAAFDKLSIAKGTEDFGSIEVLKFEITEFKKKLSEAASNITPSLASSVRQKIREKEDAIRKQESMLNSADVGDKMSYIQYLTKIPQQYTAEAKKQLAAGNRDKAQSLMTKKKIVENELEKLKMKK